MITFQEIMLSLQRYWAEKGCIVLQPYDTEMGAGTFHTATTLRSLGPEPWKVAYVQPCRRPADGRYGDNPNRLQHYYQFQVLLKPSPDDVQELYLDSLRAIGIEPYEHDVRFVEADWESPTLGAWGLGMYIQGVDSVYDLVWSQGPDGTTFTYGDVFLENEREFSAYNFEAANVEMLLQHFNDYERECQVLLDRDLPLPAYDCVLKCSHLFNLLDARGAISATERMAYILRVRTIAKACCVGYADHMARLAEGSRASKEGAVNA